MNIPTNFSVACASLATFSAPANTRGFFGGGQIGYNYQFNNSFVAAIEVDIQGVAGGHGNSSFGSTLANPNFLAFPVDQSVSVSESLEYLGAVRGRLGFQASSDIHRGLFFLLGRAARAKQAHEF